jgi:hypothetical protein
VTVSNTAAAGLVAAYGFNEGSGALVADASPFNNAGAALGTTWNASGRFGAALNFNGGSSRVTVPDSASLDLTTGMTIEAWVRPTTLAGYQSLVMKELPADHAYTLYGNSPGVGPSGAVVTTSGIQITGTATPLALNTWTHLAVTYDGAQLRLFRNGTEVAALPMTGTMLTSSNPLTIGSNSIWGEYFAGAIDEVRVYNRALSAAEIATDRDTAI